MGGSLRKNTFPIHSSLIVQHTDNELLAGRGAVPISEGNESQDTDEYWNITMGEILLHS